VYFKIFNPNIGPNFGEWVTAGGYWWIDCTLVIDDWSFEYKNLYTIGVLIYIRIIFYLRIMIKLDDNIDESG